MLDAGYNLLFNYYRSIEETQCNGDFKTTIDQFENKGKKVKRQTCLNKIKRRGTQIKRIIIKDVGIKFD